MHITAIKAQVKRVGRYSVFVDGQYSFSLSDTALLESGIISGQELTEEDVRRLKQLSDDDKLWAKVLRFTALRPRSVWEVEQYLARNHSPASQTQEILSKLTNLQLLDDLAFAQSWVENRRLLKPTSQRKLAAELKQKRISEEIITSILADTTTDDQTALQELIIRKTKQVKYRDRQKLMAYLARQGFTYDDIKAALADSKA